MCCCCKHRRAASITLSLLSLLIFGVGVTVAVYACIFRLKPNLFNSVSIEPAGSDYIVQFTTITFAILLSAGLLGAVAGMMGMLLIRCKTKSFLGIFGILLMLTWLIMASSGTLAASAAVGAKLTLEKFCDGTIPISTLSPQFSATFA